jgi:radical SAM superfamily enzyme YgiQ (UPF0313 family)
MKVVFVQDNGINESLILTELSAYLKAEGHQTALLLEFEEQNLEKAIEHENPDLIFIPSSVLAHHWTLYILRRLKKSFPDVPFVLAGSHPTFYPDILDFDEVDMILVGEVEQATAELLDALAGKRKLESIRNLHFKKGKTIKRNELRPLIEDLDSLPLPDRDLYFTRYPFTAQFPWKKFTSGRGCFHSCSYCYQPIYREMCKGKGQYVRRKSPARIVAEVRAMADKYPIGNAHFSDDLFITRLDWLREFADLYSHELNVPYSMNSSAEFVNEEAAVLLGRSGCRAVAIGIETYDEQLRYRILRKKISNDTIRRAAQLIRSYGMTLVTFNMVGSPHETVENALATMRFNAEIKTDYARVSVCFPIPKTKMATQAIEEGNCLDGYSGDIYAVKDITEEGGGVNFKTALADESRFLNLYHLFNVGVTYPSAIPLIEKLIELPPNKLFSMGSVLRMLKEKSVFRFSMSDGIKYFYHVGSPDKRATNFVSLV